MGVRASALNSSKRSAAQGLNAKATIHVGKKCEGGGGEKEVGQSKCQPFGQNNNAL